MTNELHKQFSDARTIVKVLIDDVTDYATLITFLDWQGYDWRDEETDFGDDIDLHLDFYKIANGYVQSGKYKNMAVFIDILTHTFALGQYEVPAVDAVESFYGEDEEGTVHSFETFDEFLEKYILIGSDEDLDELAERTAERLAVLDLFDELGDDSEEFKRTVFGEDGSYSSVKVNRDGMTFNVSNGITFNGKDGKLTDDELALEQLKKIFNLDDTDYDEDDYEFESDDEETDDKIQYQSVPFNLVEQVLDATEQEDDSQELIVFTNNGQTYLFSNVTKFTTTTTGFKFTYEGKMTGATREATFNNTSVSGFALK